jgi:hypothetical protein
MLMGYYGHVEPHDENLTTENDHFNARVSSIDGKAILEYTDKLHDMICRMADAFDKANPEKFKEFWYKTELERK